MFLYLLFWLHFCIQNSVGYYITAKGNFSAKQSLLKMLKLPVLYAFILGVIFNLCEIKLPEIFINYNEYIKGAYTILRYDDCRNGT